MNENDLMGLIKKLSSFGETTDKGVTRVLYDDNWIAAQKWLEEEFQSRGLNSYYDEVGNLYGRLEGEDSGNTVLTGSHVDTVVSGGQLDGQYGIIAGLVAIEYLKNKFGKPKKNIEVVSMVEEEGSRFPYTFWGSKNIIGKVKEEDVKDLVDKDGISLSDAMKSAGFKFKEKEEMRSDISAFVELHIEQGGVLEIEEKSIGIVEHIVGQNRFLVEVVGEANHAGTTPMGYRRDAMHGASKMVTKIMDLAIEYGDPLVATVGKVEVVPNTSNVVPGKVIFSIDVRHTQKDVSDNYIKEMVAGLREIAEKMNLEIVIDNYMNGIPVSMDKDLVSAIKRKCEEKKLNYKMMHSGAGHDAQIFAPKVPTALIFVPSHKGISHNPLEFTDPKDLLEGVKALAETLHELAY